jgi:hypothetical protein
MAAADIAPQFGAELKVSHTHDMVEMISKLTAYLRIGQLQTSQCVGTLPASAPFPAKKRPHTSCPSPELMYLCRTGIERHIVARRDSAILSRAKRHRKRICGEVVGTVQEIP